MEHATKSTVAEDIALAVEYGGGKTAVCKQSVKNAVNIRSAGTFAVSFVPVSFLEVYLSYAAMANTSSRTLRLLSLLQTHRFWPGPELAEVLRLFQSAFPSSSWRIVNDEQQAIDAISQALTSVQKHSFRRVSFMNPQK